MGDSLGFREMDLRPIEINLCTREIDLDPLEIHAFTSLLSSEKLLAKDICFHRQKQNQHTAAMRPLPLRPFEQSAFYRIFA